MSHYKQIRMLITLSCLALTTQITPITLRVIPIALDNDQYKVLLAKDPTTNVWQLLQKEFSNDLNKNALNYDYFLYQAAELLEDKTGDTWNFYQAGDFLDKGEKALGGTTLNRPKFNNIAPGNRVWTNFWQKPDVLFSDRAALHPNCILRIAYKTIPASDQDALAWFDVNQQGDLTSSGSTVWKPSKEQAQFLRWFKTMWNGAYDSSTGLNYQLDTLYGKNLAHYAARLAVAARKIHDTWYELKNILVINETFAGLDKQPVTIENVQYKSVWDAFNRKGDRFYGFEEPFEKYLKPLLTDMIYQSADIQGSLQATQNKIVLFKGDDHMGIGKTGSGKNEVGKLLMEIRDGINGAGIAAKKDYSLQALLETQCKSSNIFSRKWYTFIGSIRRWWYSK
jgi:hypothetical protein